MKHWVWFVPFLVPLALPGCSAPADGDPFPASETGPSSTPAAPSRPAAPAGEIAAPGGSSGAAPSTPSTPASPAAQNEGMGTLPLAPAPDDTDESGPGDGSNDAPPAGEAPAPPEAAETPAETPVPPAPPLDVPPVNLAQCVSYESGFLPRVHDPVCSSCHTGNNGLPAFEPFAQAQRRCAQIGREVASGSMPPGGGLSAAQRQTVADWVGLGCPETDAQALAQCSQAPTNGGGGAAPAAPAGDDDDDDDDDRGDDD